VGRLARLVAPFGALALAATSVLILPPSPAAAAEDATAWVRPVSGAVVAPFVPGTGRFGIGGHTGVDLAARPGAPVRAAGRGVVSFAGEVGGDPFVVVAHDGELRTTYGYLESVRVRRGQRIGAGTVVGTVGGGPGHPPGTGGGPRASRPSGTGSEAPRDGWPMEAPERSRRSRRGPAGSRSGHPA